MKKPAFCTHPIILSLGLLGSSLLSGNACKAAAVLSEPFPYVDGALTTVSGGNWTVFAGTGLPIQVSGGAAIVVNVASGTSGEDDSRALGSSFSTGLLYFSSQVTVTTAPTTASGDYFFSPLTSGGAFFGRVFVSTLTGGGIAFGLSNTGTAPTDGAAITVGTPYRLVLRLDLDAKTSTLGVFSIGSGPSSDADLNIGGGTAATATQTVTGMVLRQGSGTVLTTSVDNILVGTTLSDVAGVPEPSTYVMMASGLGLLLLGQRVRRRTVRA